MAKVSPTTGTPDAAYPLANRTLARAVTWVSPTVHAVTRSEVTAPPGPDTATSTLPPELDRDGAGDGDGEWAGDEGDVGEGEPRVLVGLGAGEDDVDGRGADGAAGEPAPAVGRAVVGLPAPRRDPPAWLTPGP